MNFVSREGVAYAVLLFLLSQWTKNWACSRADEASSGVPHLGMAGQGEKMALQGHMFPFFPSRPIVYIDGLDHSPHCAKMTGAVFPATFVSHTWPSATHFSLYLLRYCSPLPPSLKSCARNLVFGMEQLYQRSPWSPSLYRHRKSCAELSQLETCLTYIKTAIFRHLKITWMSREPLSQAFLQKESFQKHLDHVILENTVNPIPQLISHRSPLIFIPKKPSVCGGTLR